MRVFVMSLVLGLTACGGASPDIVAAFQEEDTGSLLQEAQVSDTVRDDTMSPPDDAGPEAVVAEVGDVAVEAEVSPDTADTSTIDSLLADTEVIDSSSDVSAVEVSDTNSVDTFTPPMDSGTDTFVADTYVPPIDTAPVCMYASGAKVVTGDSSAVMLNGTFMCYEIRIRMNSLPSVSENIFETSNTSHLRVWVDTSGYVTMSASGILPVFSMSALTTGVWHTIVACKVPDVTGDYYHNQLFVDGEAGIPSSAKVRMTAVITPGTLTFGWSRDYDNVHIYKRDGTTLARWSMDGNANDVGPTGLNATGSPKYTPITCP